MRPDLDLDDFDYALPPERIAQHPAAERDAARLLVLDRATGARSHARIRDLAGWLRAGDLLVVPGDADKSIIYNRAAEANGYSRMPPLATTVIDLEGAQLLAEWITKEIQPYTTYQEFRIAHFGNDTSQEGEPGEDPDGDGSDNNFEWLTNTDPDDPGRFWSFSINRIGGDISLEFPGVGSRRVIAFRSGDLLDWSRWEVRENEGTPLNPATIHVLAGPQSAAEEFFRFEIEER